MSNFTENPPAAAMTFAPSQTADRTTEFQRIFAKALAAYENARISAARHKTVGMLMGLSDRQLKDIGISRSEIESVVYSKKSTERRITYVGC